MLDWSSLPESISIPRNTVAAGEYSMLITVLLLLIALTRGTAAQQLWPSLTIPFVVDPVVEETPRLVNLDNALSQLTSKTCLQFVLRTTEPNFIIFTELPDSTPCWNVLSMKGGEQMVNVGGNCLEPVVLPATVTRIFSDCDIQKVQYLYPCPGTPPIKQTNCTSIFNRVNNVPASIVPCEEDFSCPMPVYKNNTLPLGSPCTSACDYGGALLPFLRSFNPQAGVSDHFYTTDAVRHSTLAVVGYVPEDPLGYLGQAGPTDQYCTCLVPLFRMFHPLSKDHFYTTNTTERDIATALGYQMQNTEGYCTLEPACGAYMPLFRFYNMFAADHFYTTNKEEMSFLKLNPMAGYGFERVECYIWQYSKANRACETVEPQDAL